MALNTVHTPYIIRMGNYKKPEHIKMEIKMGQLLGTMKPEKKI